MCFQQSAIIYYRVEYKSRTLNLNEMRPLEGMCENVWCIFLAGKHSLPALATASVLTRCSSGFDENSVF